MSDLIQEYLRQLRTSLRTALAGNILAEAEDHLRETVAAGLAAGLTEQEAQEAAISAFGSIRAVARAHRARPGNLFRGRTPEAVLGELIMAAWKLAGIGLTAIGASGAVALVMNVTLGRRFVGLAPAAVTFPKAKCAYWLAGWPDAHTCAQAAMLEASSDAVTLRVLGGIAGLALLETYLLVRFIQRRRGHEAGPLLAGYFPALAASVFGAGAMGLAMLQVTGFTVTAGPGAYLSGIIVAAALAVGYGWRARPLFEYYWGRGLAR
jgi:hypothetical protein